MEKDRSLLVPINVNDNAKSKFDNLYGCEEFSRWNKKSTDVMMSEKLQLCWICDGKGSAASQDKVELEFYRRSRSYLALQAAMEGYEVVLMEAINKADIVVTATGNKDIVTADHMRNMKDRAIRIIGHFDNEIQVEALKIIND